MSTPLEHRTIIAALAAASVAGSMLVASAQSTGEAGAQSGNEPLGIGQVPSKELIEAWNIDISPAGDNLPEGRGSVNDGKAIYANSCVACHGETGTEGPMDKLAGGQGSLDTDKPVKTVGSYWPYATTLYDYIRRAMPFDSPQSLTDDQVYAVTAYVLNLNGIISDDAVLDKETLRKVQMPNRDSFEQMDTVTSTETAACMEDCEPFSVEMDGTTPETINEEQVQ
jgi:cytochrome c